MNSLKSSHEEQVILVNSSGKSIGTMNKMSAHENGGSLHRAFSVFVFNTSGELLLQRRALSKYHSGGLLTNTCCSHPRPEESTMEAAIRRLNEEMGMECELSEKFTFEYKAELDKGLVEWEYDHVFIGVSDVRPEINFEEVGEYIYMSLEDIQAHMLNSPEEYTAWFRVCFDKIKDEFSKLF
jgi:isopentenyl-diphosphate delta-isomerase